MPARSLKTKLSSNAVRLERSQGPSRAPVSPGGGVTVLRTRSNTSGRGECRHRAPYPRKLTAPDALASVMRPSREYSGRKSRREARSVSRSVRQAAGSCSRISAALCAYPVQGSHHPGVVIGCLLARVTFLATMFDPYVRLLNALPRVVLAPIFLLWFGLGILSKVALGVTVVFFIVFFNSYQE